MGSKHRLTVVLCLALLVSIATFVYLNAEFRVPEYTGDTLHDLQNRAIALDKADWGHWGSNPAEFTGWTNHSNRLIPIYTFGIELDKYRDQHSLYRHEDRVQQMYGRLPHSTVDENANYLDQTDIYRIQKDAIKQGKKFIFLIIFDGMDWQTTQAAAIYRNQEVAYSSGRGSGLAFQDYDQVITDFGFHVSSPYNDTTTVDVNAQIVTGRNERFFGGYNPKVGGYEPWSEPTSYPYLMSRDWANPHAYTDSAASGTSMTCGIKSYNGAINVDPDANQVVPIARQLQDQGFSVGAVTSVPISHATPACAYANNVSRSDYQDLSRDMLGISSIANRRQLKGMEVLIGCGWGIKPKTKSEFKDTRNEQGLNYSFGNKYLTEDDFLRLDHQYGGGYAVAIRSAGKSGKSVLEQATKNAIDNNLRLFGFFGTKDAHLPYATADGDYAPAKGESEHEKYTPADLHENPTLQEMTEAALSVLETNQNGFWLMVEPGDVDWANHQNNIDNSIGAVFSGEAAFTAVTSWIERNDCWDQSAVIVTADHGHLLVLQKPEALIPR